MHLFILFTKFSYVLLFLCDFILPSSVLHKVLEQTDVFQWKYTPQLVMVFPVPIPPNIETQRYYLFSFSQIHISFSVLSLEILLYRCLVYETCSTVSYLFPRTLLQSSSILAYLQAHLFKKFNFFPFSFYIFTLIIYKYIKVILCLNPILRYIHKAPTAVLNVFKHS